MKSINITKKEAIAGIITGGLLVGVIVVGGMSRSPIPAGELPPPPGIDIAEERPLTDQEARALGLPITPEEWAAFEAKGGDTLIVDPGIATTSSEAPELPIPTHEE